MAVNKQVIYEGVSGMPFSGNEHGLMDVFGVFLSSGSAEFYNALSFKYLKKLPRSFRSEGEKILTNAAWVCGYNTFRGIQTSAEWDGLIAPMVENSTDQLIASIEVCNALGWVKWQLTDVDPGRRAVVEAEKGYEAELFLRDYGKSASPVCYMLQGVVSALCDLSYGKEYPEGIYTFDTKETACRGAGAAKCVFIAERK